MKVPAVVVDQPSDDRLLSIGVSVGSHPRQPRVRLYLLGAFRLVIDDEPVDPAEWRLKKAQSLVKLLALAPGYQLNRDTLIETLWPELDLDAALNNFHRTLHAARRVFDTARPCNVLQLRKQVLSLGPPDIIWIDVTAFESAAGRAFASDDVRAYRDAIALYTGDLLADDPYEDWIDGRRDELCGTYLSLLIALGRRYQAERNHDLARETFDRAVAHEPTREGAHVALMRLYALAGRRTQALQQYEQLRRALSAELDAEPDPATRQLHDDIQDGRFPPPSASTASDQPALAYERQREHGHPIEQGESPVTRRNPPNTNLPVQLTTFINRVQEIEQVRQQLASNQLLTLTGAGGSGKTRLAVEASVGIVEQFADGVWFIDLAGLMESVLVPATIAAVLDVREEPGKPRLETLAERLRDRQVLLVLDNCEHLIGATARLVDRLLRSCPRLHILATSREPLHVPGEHVLVVPPLAIPDPAHRSSFSELREIDAVRLFVERARYNDPDFEVTEQNAAAVAEICHRLDGMPLAIELAAARLRTMLVEEIREHLDDSLRLLSSGPRTVATRQQTLRDAVDWSYRLLGPDEQRMLRAIAVFADGFMLDAARAVYGLQGEDLVFPLLHQLVDKSLLQLNSGAPRPRFRMLEPIRQYADDRQREAGEETTVRSLHRDWYLTMAEQAEYELMGPKQKEWLDRFETEHSNLRLALDWCLREAEGREAGLRLAAGVWRFWEIRGHLDEGRDWLKRLLEGSDGVAVAIRVKALIAAGILARDHGDRKSSRELLEESLALSREMGFRLGVGRSLLHLGMLEHIDGNDDAAERQLREGLDLLRAEHDAEGIANCLNWLGFLATERGNGADAIRYYEESLAIYRSLGDTTSIGRALNNLGRAVQLLGDHERAQHLVEEALALRRQLGDRQRIAISLRSLGDIALSRDIDKAAICYRESLSLFRELGITVELAPGLERLAEVAAAERSHERAAKLLGAAERLRDETAYPIAPAQRPDHERRLATLRDALGEDAFAALWQHARAMPVEQVITTALSDGCC